MSPLVFGRIVWAEVADPHGRNPKVRPLVVLSPTADITPDGVIRAVACSTRVGMAPADVCVPLPWDRTGHPKTKLREPTVAVCSWAVELPVAAVLDTAGVVSGRHILAIQSAMKRIETEASPPPPPPSPE